MRASPLLQTPSPLRVLYMAVLSGANSYIMADGNVNEFGISDMEAGSLLGVQDGLLHVRSRVKLSMENREKGC